MLSASEIDAVCTNVSMLYHLRASMRRTQDLTLSRLRAFGYRLHGWRHDDPNRAAIETTVGGLVDKLAKGQPSGDLQLDIRAIVELDSIKLRSAQDKVLTKQAAAPVITLPVWPFIEAIKGVGEEALITIIGEAGNLSQYQSPRRLRKRMGLAPYVKEVKGEMVGRSGGQWCKQGGLTPEEFTALGYKASRRGALFGAVSQPLIFNNGTGKYKTLLNEEKARIAAVHPDWKKGRCYGYAFRKMEQAFLLDLWLEWHGITSAGAAPPETPETPSSVVVAT